MSNGSDSDLFPEFRNPLPNATAIMRDQLHIPVHPRMDARDTKHIAEAVRQAVREVG
jgi:dTDP-4-amino-4,6-dideoxygalactose transaminase